MEAQAKAVGKAKGGGPGRGITGLQRNPVLGEPPTLKEAGIDKRLADPRPPSAPQVDFPAGQIAVAHVDL